MHCELLDSINRACQASVSYGYQLPEQEVIPTGLPQLDTVIGGGVPRGRIKCKYSPPGKEAKINLIYGEGLTA